MLEGRWGVILRSMNVGRCDVCLRVTSAAASRRFYETLGFRSVEGSDEEGWCVVTNGDLRLGLFEGQFMGEVPVSLNFRGGNIGAIVTELATCGHTFVSDPKVYQDGTGSARLTDPDGHLIFFDTAPGELEKNIRG